jgi:hypothetical protein
LVIFIIINVLIINVLLEIISNTIWQKNRLYINIYLYECEFQLKGAFL